MKLKDPVVFAEHALLYGVKEEVPDEFFEIPFGKANIKRTGDSITIISYSGMVRTCMEASEIISKDFNVECEVIDLRTLRPLDFETIIKSVKKTGRAVVVEEAWKTGGFGANISESIQLEAFDYLDGPIIRIASEDVPAPYNRKLELATIPSEQKIIAAIKQNFSI